MCKKSVSKAYYFVSYWQINITGGQKYLLFDKISVTRAKNGNLTSCRKIDLEKTMAHCSPSRKLVSILFNGSKKLFCFLDLILKSKNNKKVNVVTLAQITFPNALSFSILGERGHYLAYWTNSQRQGSLAPSLVCWYKEIFSSSVSNKVCIEQLQWRISCLERFIFSRW